MAETAVPQPRRAATLFILITVVLDTVAIGLVVPVLPKLIRTIGGGGMAHTALIFGLFATIFAVMQFLVSPFQGALSDRFGRRPVILASNIGLGLDYLVMALAPNLYWLFTGRLLSGVAAGSGPAAYAYIADVTPQEKRAQGFGLIFAAQALGSALGPALGGLLSQLDLRAPFWTAAALSLVNALYGLLVLPESHPAQRRVSIDWSQLNPLGGLIWLVRTYPKLAAMVVVAVLLSLASQGVNNIAVVYANYRYHWTPRDIGLLLTVFGVASLGAQAGLVSVAERRLGDKATMVCSLSLTVIGLVLFGLAPNSLLFSLGVPLLALGAISGPMMAGYFSRSVGEEEQGRLQGVWTSVISLTGLIAPGLFTLIFAISISGDGVQRPGVAFLIAAGMIVVAIMLCVRTVWTSSYSARHPMEGG